jgi:hypothetical protein
LYVIVLMLPRLVARAAIFFSSKNQRVDMVTMF